MDFASKFEEFKKNNDETDEWFYNNFLDSILKEQTPESAFKLIPEVVDYSLIQSDNYIAFQMLQVAITLSYKAGTTEIPSGLLEKIPLIRKKFENKSNYSENVATWLRDRYRIRP